MPDPSKPIKAFRTPYGWATFDSFGRTWPISDAEAADLPKTKTYEQLANDLKLETHNEAQGKSR